MSKARHISYTCKVPTALLNPCNMKFDEFYDKQHHKDKVQHSSCSIDGNDFEGEKGDQQTQEEERVEQPQEEERVEQNQEEERVELPQEEERVDNEENQEVAHRQDDTVGKRELTDPDQIASFKTWFEASGPCWRECKGCEFRRRSSIN